MSFPRDDTNESQWVKLKLADAKSLDDDEIAKAFQWTCKYGSGNCWAGSHGEAAEMIRKLILEIARLRS